VSERTVDYLLVGGGQAGASCARTLREEGADGSILLAGRELDPPYERPPLSKGYLAGRSSREDALFAPDGWWEEQGIELRTRTSAMKLDAGERTVKLSSGEVVRFGKLLLATGANVRRLRVDGCDLEGLHYLRTFGNADAIRADAQDAERVVLLGGSYIGCELAASLTALGKRCEIVCLEEVVFEHALGHEAGRFFHSLLEERGVRIHGGQELERFEGDGRVRRVVTTSGLELDCDLVAIGAGVVPDAMLARGGGVELGESGGIRCSSRLETSVPGVYAAGDVAEYDSVVHGRALRVEHHEVAVAQGRIAALNMLGRDVAHEEVAYFWSDLADWATLEYVGAGGGEPVVRGSLDDGEFTVFYLGAGGRVAAALTVGRPADLDEARRWIAAGAAPDAAALADRDTDLAAL
jgi:3-phenylpropionate/trans-cinnamate dioxygenase ferredoxin reductase component